MFYQNGFPYEAVRAARNISFLFCLFIVGFSFFAWSYFTTPSRSDFEREAIEHGAAVYQADGKFRWVDVVAEYNLSEKIGYERGLKAGSAKVFKWAKEKGIDLPAE